MRGLGNIFHSILLFSHSKASDTNIGIIAILVHFEIPYCSGQPDMEIPGASVAAQKTNWFS